MNLVSTSVFVFVYIPSLYLFLFLFFHFYLLFMFTLSPSILFNFALLSMSFHAVCGFACHLLPSYHFALPLNQ